MHPALSALGVVESEGLIELEIGIERLSKQKAEYMCPARKKVYVKEETPGALGPAGTAASGAGRNAYEPFEGVLEQQLLQSQRLEALGTLVGGIAHDFNNILNVITGHVSLMERWRENPEKFAKSFDAVKKATDRGARTARQLLSFSRKAEVVTEQVRIDELVKELAALLKEIFPEKIHFSVDLEHDIPTIQGDSNRIYQALLNLCMNARDAMPDSGRIVISARSVGRAALDRRYSGLAADRYVQVVVSDSGSGMSGETLAHIFEPFFTTKEGGHGTGLGLSVVDWIMKTHNGFVGVESRVGTGTEFSLFFPVLPQSEQSIVEKKKEAELPHGSGELILAIEDEEPLRDFLKAILEESGYRVLVASDGTEGLKTYTKHSREIDLVLLDMGLPEVSGSEVLAELVLLNPSVRVISASGYVQPEVKTDAFVTGAMDFLPKPYLVDELLTKVQRALRAGTDKYRKH